MQLSAVLSVPSLCFFVTQNPQKLDTEFPEKRSNSSLRC
jgi:hypothetical protein